MTPSQFPRMVPTNIQVLDNDTYVGTPSIQIVGSDGGRAVANGLVVTYTAPSVVGDQARSFTYLIVDANGTSNTATVDVTVLDSAAPAVSNANCYPATGLVNTPAWIDVGAGIRREWRGGRYAHSHSRSTAYGGSLNFTAEGSEANPIVIRTHGFEVSSSQRRELGDGCNKFWLVFKDLFFNNSLAACGTNNVLPDAVQPR